jgi:hypothetical protein
MKKVLLLAIVLGCALIGWAATAHAGPPSQGDTTPAITSFTTPWTQVDRVALARRTARIPVSWKTTNRPVTANLVFEQVLPNGHVINVELPRENPWVASAGDGIAAPILPGWDSDHIVLRVQLVSLLTRHVYDERTIMLAIGTTNTNPPAITSFTTCCPTVKESDLAARTARMPVSWTTANRPVTANLVFEQVLPDGRVVNVELPRVIPWVASAGDGVAAPISPGNGADTLLLQVRLVDLVDGRVYDRREIVVAIDRSPAPSPSIRYFYTTATRANAARLAARTERIPVLWTVDNRPDGSNLVFEQVLPDGSALNVELPREIPWVASSGSGVVAPVLPSSGNTLVIRLRLINLADGTTLVTSEFTLPIEGQGNPTVQIVYFSATPETALYNSTVTLSWEVRNASQISIREVYSDGRYGQWYPNLSASGTLDVITPEPPQPNITYLLVAEGADGSSTSHQVTIPLGENEPPDPDLVINAFQVSPNPVEHGGTVTLTWDVSGATSVSIYRLEELTGTPIGPIFLAEEMDFSGTLSYTLPLDHVNYASFSLDARDASGRVVTQEITTKVSCPFTDSLTVDCPISQETVQAAYQPFENGHMAWFAHTDAIYVLYSDGTYEQFPDTWVEGETFDVGDPPDGRVTPERGFGKVWATQPGVRDKLGWGLGEEQGYSTPFETHLYWPGPGVGQTTSEHFRLPDNRVVHVEWTIWRLE